jgi:hypothetical protein
MIALKYSSFKGLLLAATILPGPLILVTPIAATAQVGVVISVQVAPPMLPVYAQPPMPEEGYLDPGLLAVGCTDRVLLGSGDLGPATDGRCSMDSALLGLE